MNSFMAKLKSPAVRPKINTGRANLVMLIPQALITEISKLVLSLLKVSMEDRRTPIGIVKTMMDGSLSIIIRNAAFRGMP